MVAWLKPYKIWNNYQGFSPLFQAHVAIRIWQSRVSCYQAISPRQHNQSMI
jgi:hypothetical protein